MYIADGSSYDYDATVQWDYAFYAWGWLDKQVIDRDWGSGREKYNFLQELVEAPIIHKSYMGTHQCRICDQDLGQGSKVIISKGVHYKCPAGVAHYIEKHNYCPPPEVVRAFLGEHQVVDKPYSYNTRILKMLSQKIRALIDYENSDN